MTHAHFILDTQFGVYVLPICPLGWSLRQRVAQSNINGYARSTLHAAGFCRHCYVNFWVITVETDQPKLVTVSLPAINQCVDSSDVLCCTRITAM
jgi:hypothetical protein